MRVILGLFLLLFTANSFADYSYVGVGVTIEKKKEGVQVINLIKDGPAHRAGVLIGEWLAAVDGNSTKNKKIDEVSDMIIGDAKPGSLVTFTLAATPDLKQTHDVRIQREVITIQCYMEGWVNLNYNQMTNQINGYINNVYVMWTVNGTMVTGYYRGEYVRLNFGTTPTTNSWNLTGFIHNSYINWQSAGTSINRTIGCIP